MSLFCIYSPAAGSFEFLRNLFQVQTILHQSSELYVMSACRFIEILTWFVRTGIYSNRMQLGTGISKLFSLGN